MSAIFDAEACEMTLFANNFFNNQTWTNINLFQFDFTKNTNFQKLGKLEILRVFSK